MSRFALICVVVFCFSSTAFGQSPTRVEGHATYSTNSSAQGVAEMQARCGQCKHFGGNRGYEGVGFSTSSSDAAIKNCCYWGQRKPREIGVSRGPRGWFACVRYH